MSTTSTQDDSKPTLEKLFLQKQEQLFRDVLEQRPLDPQKYMMPTDIESYTYDTGFPGLSTS